MEKEYNMTINRLPSKTWNWLRMNETQLEDPRGRRGKSHSAGEDNDR